mgnify:FL=1
MYDGFLYQSPEYYLGSPSYFYNVTSNGTVINQPVDCQAALSVGNLANGNDYPNWLSTTNNIVDLRFAFVECCPYNKSLYCSQFNTSWPNPNTLLNNNSSESGQLVMFTSDALYYAQSGYFVTIVMIQWSNVFACKSRKVLIC